MQTLFRRASSFTMWNKTFLLFFLSYFMCGKNQTKLAQLVTHSADESHNSSDTTLQLSNVLFLNFNFDFLTWCSPW